MKAYSSLKIKWFLSSFVNANLGIQLLMFCNYELEIKNQEIAIIGDEMPI